MGAPAHKKTLLLLFAVGYGVRLRSRVPVLYHQREGSGLDGGEQYGGPVLECKRAVEELTEEPEDRRRPRTTGCASVVLSDIPLSPPFACRECACQALCGRRRAGFACSAEFTAPVVLNVSWVGAEARLV